MKISAAKKLCSGILALLLLTSCSANANPENTDDIQDQNNGGIAENLLSGFLSGSSENDEQSGDFYPEAKYSEFDLNTDISSDAVYIKFNGTNVETDSAVDYGDGYVTITDGGDYVLSGYYTGEIYVNSSENVHLILNGITIEAEMSPINIKSAKNVCITLAEGTINRVSDTSNYTFSNGDDEPAAAIYSKADLTINGSGTLEVNGNYDKGIHSKDDLKIVSGIINVTSAGDAIKGKDSLLIHGGEISVVSNEDGLKSNNDEDEEKGYIIIDGGKIGVSVGDDGIHAESWLIINGGDINITKSYEGIESKKIEIYGGDIIITASDDGINAASGTSSGNNFDKNIGNFDSMTNERGAKGTVPPDGEMIPDESFSDRGFSEMNPPDRDVPEPQENEGFSRGEKNKNFGGDSFDRGETGGKMGGGNEAAEDGVYIRICGGNIFVDAGVDSIDSNGTLEISGGNITISGTSMAVWGSPDCMLDTNGEAVVSGGTFAAYARSASSAENAVLLPSITLTNVKDSENATVTDSKGDLILSFDDIPSCSVLYIASDKLTSGETYTINIDGTISEATCK
ncbi:MAG: carbohydrate-binding domain-containing protein [Eubacteriales bacterium]